MKIAVIGGGGKISSATIYELLNDISESSMEFALFGHNDEKIADTIALSARFNKGNASVYKCDTLECALRDASIVFYCATYGTSCYDGLRSMGITNGAYLLHIGKKVTEICPNAWLLTVTNPPCVPLMAIKKRYGHKKSIGLCNAPIFVKRMTASFLDCDESELRMLDFGVNHEFWYYEICRNGVDIYDELRERLEYDYKKISGKFHTDFPEWRYGFSNTVELLRLSGYLSGPVGGSNRYKNLPVTDMWSISSRPTAADFKALLDPTLTNSEVLDGTRRCAAGIPIYCADVIKSLILDDGREHPVLAFNNTSKPEYNPDSMLQMTCKVNITGLTNPDLSNIPEYINAVMASRIHQNHLMSEALAMQDDMLLRQSLLIYPERIDPCDTDEFLQKHQSVEPFIQLD